MFLANKPVEGGSTVGAHRRQFLKTKGIKVRAEGDAPPPPPAGTEHVWAVFQDLQGSRRASFGGMLPIPISEIDAWSRLMCVPLSPWEVRVIQGIDAVWLDVHSKK